jgi:spoIIIJ-associated protein
MKRPEYIEVEANTVKEAIGKATKMLNCKRKDIDIKVLTEGERGLFDMRGAKPARIRSKIKKTPQK